MTLTTIRNFSRADCNRNVEIDVSLEDALALGTKALFQPDGFAEEYPFAADYQVGRDTVIFTGRVPLMADGFLQGRLVKDSSEQEKPKWKLHDWVAGSPEELKDTTQLKAHIKLPDLSVLAISCTLATQPDAPLPDGQVSKVFEFSGEKDGWVAKFFLKARNDDPILDYEFIATWSDRTTTLTETMVESIALETGEYITVDHGPNLQEGFAQFSQSRDHVTVISGRRGFIDGSSIVVRGQMICAPENWEELQDQHEEEIQNALSAAQGPVVGTTARGRAKFLALESLPILNEGTEADGFIRSIELQQDTDLLGDHYATRSIGCANDPGATGTQEDFGALLGFESVVVGDPMWKRLAPVHVDAEFYRGYLLYEGSLPDSNGTKLLRSDRHPQWTTFSGRTHWSASRSPDRIGKGRGFGSYRATGFDTHDPQHVSMNNLATLYAMTGSPAYAELIHGIMVIHSAQIVPTSSPRAIGRQLHWWANVMTLFPSNSVPFGQARELIERMVAHVSTNMVGDDIMVTGIAKADPRRPVYDMDSGLLVESASAWEHGLLSVGLRAALQVFLDLKIDGPTSEALRAILERVADAYLRLFTYTDSMNGAVYLVDDIAWEGGRERQFSDLRVSGNGVKGNVLLDSVSGTADSLDGVSFWAGVGLYMCRPFIGEEHRVEYDRRVEAFPQLNPAYEYASLTRKWILPEESTSPNAE